MFGGGGSIQLARILGIRIGASPSWFIVLFVMLWWVSDSFRDQLDGSETEAYLTATGAVLGFFGSLILHELGHALVARRRGVEIEGIDLWFFGGVAKLKGDSRSPGEEFQIAAAGPAVTALVVLVCVGALAVTGLDGGQIGDVLRLEDTTEITPARALFGFVAAINILLLVFNLVPAFPLDGGRIARAIAWKATGDRNKATRAAGKVGLGFAYILIGVGAFLVATDDVVDGIYLGVLGWFLSQAARQAVVASEFSERLDGITVSDIMDAEPVAMPADLQLIRADEEFFLRYGWDWFPVVDQHGRYVGIARREAVEAEIAAGRPALTIREIVPTGDRPEMSVAADRPLEALLGDEQLRERGALMAIDSDGVLRGVVTVEQVRRALAAALPSKLG